jgi:hypothetical protein
MYASSVDTDAIGIIVVTIHRATGIKSGDLDGGSGSSLLRSAFPVYQPLT